MVLLGAFPALPILSDVPVGAGADGAGILLMLYRWNLGFPYPKPPRDVFLCLFITAQ